MQETRTDAHSQQFRFLQTDGGYVRIQARHSGQVVDVYDWNASDGATIAQWPDLGGTDQQWSVIEQSDGTYSFVDRFSEKALDLWEWSTTPGARISQYTYDGLAVQRWQLVPVDSGGLTNPTRSNGADPWLEYWGGYYYLSTTTWDSIVIMRRSTTLAGLATAPDTVVWDDSAVASRRRSHWARSPTGSTAPATSYTRRGTPRRTSTASGCTCSGRRARRRWGRTSSWGPRCPTSGTSTAPVSR